MTKPPILFITLICAVVSQSTPAPSLQCTTKGKHVVVQDGFLWRKKTLKDSDISQVWLCPKKTCNAYGRSAIGSEIIEVITQHNHNLDLDDINRRLAIEKMKDMARHEVHKTACDIVHQVRGEVPDDTLMTLPNGVASVRAVQRARHTPQTKQVNRKHTYDIIIEGPYATTKRGMSFLSYDSRHDAAYSGKPILIFATRAGYNRMADPANRHWGSDGTFSVVPSTFYQLYTFHVFVRNAAIPGIYALMTDKSEESYFHLFTIIRRKSGASPLIITTDFELAARNAFMRVFPQVEVRYCLFHMAQSLHRRVQEQHLTTLYKQNLEFAKTCRMLVALALLPMSMIDRAFLIVSAHYKSLRLQRHHPTAISILDYFERNYIDNERALFPPSSWNHYGSVTEERPRTNNAVESFHLHLRNRFHREHPPLSRLILVLQDVEENAYQKMRFHRVHPSKDINMYSRKRKNDKNDEAVYNIVRALVALPAPTNDDILRALLQLQNYLYKKRFDTWTNNARSINPEVLLRREERQEHEIDVNNVESDTEPEIRDDEGIDPNDDDIDNSEHDDDEGIDGGIQ